MTRREYLETMVKAGLLYAVPFTTILSCDSRDGSNKSFFFVESDFKFLSVLAETIMPQTNTIGAMEAGVPHFIDLYLQHCADANSQREYLKNLNWYKEHLSGLNISIQKPSPELTSQWISDEKKLSDKGILDFMKETKKMTLKGYFYNQKAIEQNLYYLAVPKEYKACVEVTKTAKMWIN